MKKLLIALLLLLSGREAWADPVGWAGTWKVDGGSTRALEETLPGQLTLTAELPIEGASRSVELSGSATDSGLALDTLWVDGIGIVGMLENVKTRHKHAASLRATATSEGSEVVVLARFLVDGAEVARETWRARRELELVGLEAGGKPLAGDLDVKRAGSLVTRFRVQRGAMTVRARVELEPGHPYPCFYAGPLCETSLGTLEPGEHTFTWDGRDSTAAHRIALAGPYRVVLEPVAAAQAAQDDGLPLPPAALVTGAVSACFTVAPPRLELICSDWPANYGNVTRPRWSEGPALDRAAGFLQGHGPFAFAGASVLKDATEAARRMKDSSFALLETHGNTDSVWFYKGDPSVPWKQGDPEDGITGRYFGPGDLEDLHFGVALICDGAIRDAQGHSFVADLRDAGCDVAIGFEATIDVGEGQRFRDIMLRFVASGAPVEKAARDAALETFRQSHLQPSHFLFWTTGWHPASDADLDAMIERERAAPADPNVNYGIKSLASSIVVERGKGIPASESMWPPRYGNAGN